MKLIQFTLLSLFLNFPFGLSGQVQGDKVFMSYGYSSIPIHIDRTDLTRWMIFPSFEVGYRINEKFALNASYLGQDIALNKSSPEQRILYKEVPSLTSYEEAVLYEGKKSTVSLFYDYIFGGLLYDHYRSGFFSLQANLQIGYRFGETSLLTNISERPSWPNGFEVHATILSSASPGVKFAVSPRVIIFDFLTFDVSIGSFVFINWPALQPFGSMKMGLSF